MKPLPKWMGILGNLAAVYGALESAGVFVLIPPHVRAVVIAVGATVSTLSHSLTGSGGK